MSSQQLRNAYKNLRQRCFNPKRTDYLHECNGNRCEWETFRSFADAMGQRPTSSHQLMRKDLQKGFTKENCFWGRKSQVAMPITHNGITRTVQEWSQVLCIPLHVMLKRIASGKVAAKVLAPVRTTKQPQRERERIDQYYLIRVNGNQYLEQMTKLRCNASIVFVDTVLTEYRNRAHQFSRKEQALKAAQSLDSNIHKWSVCKCNVYRLHPIKEQ